MKYKINKIVKAAVIIIMLILTVSCISIETEIKFSDNNSGTVKLKYRVSKMVVKTSEIDSDSSFLPLPLEEKDFIAKAAENDSLSLVSFKREESSDEVFISAEFSFSDIDGLNAAAGSAAEPVITVDKKLTKTVYTHLLYPGSNNNIDTETMQVITDLYSNYPVKITVIAPSDIKTVNMGNAQNNKAEIQMTIPEILSSEDPVSIELSW